MIFTRLIILLLMAQGAFAGELGLSLGWPYAGLKYNLSDKISVEGRYAAETGVSVVAGRTYWTFSRREKLNLFAGAEYGVVKFNTTDLKGTGYEAGGFIGTEYFIFRNCSVLMDFYPAFIGLKSDNYSISGLEWVTNVGLNYYFGGVRAAESGKEAAGLKQSPVIEAVKSAVIKPLTGDERFARAEKFSVQGNYAQAEAEYRLILEAAPDLLEANNGLAGALMKQGRLDEAEKIYLELLDSLLPSDAEFIPASRRLGEIYIKRGEYKQGIKYFNMAAKLGEKQKASDSAMFNAYSGLAYCYEKTGDNPRARTAYEKALRHGKGEKALARIKKRLTALQKSESKSGDLVGQ